MGESDMTTKKHPRTLQEAFGPYTHDYIYDDDDDINWWWWAVWVVLAIGVGVLICL
ncbi:hypothetical protein UFOVP764_25 [uncultured Caudovirales phage]|jgi:hypothetical protein|uniref:Uncharacterized protein n=1 Tax=uncultured Caudovirales phage TaxID=2100421 RepID=A0A6J5NV00_9CAUD|nr:hypothetical protein UFOVP764_25 [uncultured Caudovirales phage]